MLVSIEIGRVRGCGLDFVLGVRVNRRDWGFGGQRYWAEDIGHTEVFI